MARRAELAEVKAARAEVKRREYQRRLDEGQCTLGACLASAAPDSNMCATCGPSERERKRVAIRTKRGEARKAGRCIDCDAKSVTCRCIDCQIKSGRIAKRVLARLIAASSVSVARPVMATTIERDSRYPDGRVRTRYRGGQGRRGAPDKLKVIAADLDLAIACLRRAREKLDEACGMTEPRERKAKVAEALGQGALAGRMIDAVVDRAEGERR